MENQGDDQLRSLIAGSGLTSSRFEDGRQNITFAGRLRPFDFSLWLSHNWLCLRVTLLPLPTPQGLRSAILSAALSINCEISMVKIGLAWDNTLVLDGQARVEQMDGEALANFLGLAHRVAETTYARLVEIASGKGTLTGLEAAFNRSPAGS